MTKPSEVAPPPEPPAPAHAVTCYTCHQKVWEGDDPPADGQKILTKWADKNCKRSDCKSTTAAVKRGLSNS